MCGYKDSKNKGYTDKVAWNTKMYELGMRYNYLMDEKDNAIGGIEFMPSESSLRPIQAPGYIMINCLYIMKKPYKGQGFGKQLLDSCVDYAKNNNFSGVAAIVRKGSWMADSSLFIKNGFTSAGKVINGYELVYLKIDDTADIPFVQIKDIPGEYNEGLHVFYSCQCPYTAKAIDDIASIASKEFGLTCNLINLDNNEIAKFSPFGTFHIVHNGELIAFHPISGTRFKNIMSKRV